MNSLQNKIDFVALVSVTRANSNGDPLNGNRPRTDLNGFGEISDVCIKRKIRNRMQDLGKPIFVQSEDRCSDGCGSLSERASAAMKGIKDREEFARHACETWLDVRAFGQVFAFKDTKGFSCGVRGPVSVHQASSLSPVEIESLQITKSVNGEKGYCANVLHCIDTVVPELKGDKKDDTDEYLRMTVDGVNVVHAMPVRRTVEVIRQNRSIFNRENLGISPKNLSHKMHVKFDIMADF